MSRVAANNAAVVHLQKHPCDVSIARPTKWGSPFEVGRDGTPSECVAKYREWIKSQPSLLADLHELEGKRLGCWCKTVPNGPEACHGDVLMELANGLKPGERPVVPSEPVVKPPEPHPLDLVDAPKTWTTTKRICDRLSVAGVGNKDADIMFVATCPQEDELTEAVKLHYGQSFKLPARLLKGASGALLQDISLKTGFSLREDCYYTALVKWLPERGKRTNPRKEDILFWGDVLKKEIEEVKPRIVVCLGKAAFDFLYPVKFKKNDLKGGFFRPPGADYLLYPCDDPGTLVKRPELYGRFYLDFQEVSRMRRVMEDVDGVSQVPRNYRTIFNKEQLEALVVELEEADATMVAVDCEWHGRNHVDGRLRTIQFAWAAGEAAVVRFMDDKLNFVFDCSYAEAGMVLGKWFNRPQVRYVGHHYAADAPWMREVLGLETFEKCYLDSEFALQCCDEFADLSLERLAMAYTDLGRYDVDLLIWKKTSGVFKEEDGYGLVPDDILIPYSAMDVDVCIRALPFILRYLEREKVSDYYFNILHPFVTDVFTEFATQGLPMDVERMDELRFVLHAARRLMEGQVQEDIRKEAQQLLWERMVKQDPNSALETFQAIENHVSGDGDLEAGFAVLKGFAGVERLHEWDALYKHYCEAGQFNIRSHPDMRRWLFDVKGYEPIKSTKNDAQGIPSTPWERVREMPEARRSVFTPSVDRQTLEILASQNDDKLLFQLLELNATGNLCKAFLKEAELDPETGEPVKENGLHFWLASDDRVHGQMSTTETGRPRAWRPNCLNWPSYTRKQISDGLKRCFRRALDEGRISEDSREASYLTRNIPPVRSCVTAPEGWVMVESDYSAAELRAWAFQSGDEGFIALMTQPDRNFGLAKWRDPDSGEEEVVQVRLGYGGTTGISDEHKDAGFFMTLAEDSAVTARFGEGDLLRDSEGAVIHPSADLHWVLAEMVHGKPREMLNKKRDRGAAKVGNFCLAEGQRVMTQRGPVNIEDVRGCDQVWDGLEWVHHEGVVYQGEKEVIHYQGLWATKEHEVWVEGREGKIHLGEAVAQSLELRRPPSPRQAPEGGWSGDFSGDRRKAGVGIFLHQDRVRGLLRCAVEGASKLGERVLLKVSVLGGRKGVCEMAGSSSARCQVLAGQVSGDEAALREGHSRLVVSLQGKGNPRGVPVSGRIRDLGLGNLARRIFRRKGLRQEGQRRELLEGESSAGRQNYEPAEPIGHRPGEHRHGEGISTGAPSCPIHREDGFGAVEVWPGRRGDTVPRGTQYPSRMAKTYDILNAGPLNRFVCEGVLVSNSSAYGAVAATLERKIEQETGVRPEPGTGERLLEALKASRPQAFAWMEALEETPKFPGWLRSASGRKRRFALHPSDVAGISGSIRRGILSGQSREARNFFPQEIVAATAARASVWLLREYRRRGMRAYPMICLYDSVVTLCPISERHVVAELHQKFMTDINQWSFHGRIMNFPIETELVRRWSTKPTAEEAAAWAA